jgi:hypothetical protein
MCNRSCNHTPFRIWLEARSDCGTGISGPSGELLWRASTPTPTPKRTSLDRRRGAQLINSVGEGYGFAQPEMTVSVTLPRSRPGCAGNVTQCVAPLGGPIRCSNSRQHDVLSNSGGGGVGGIGWGLRGSRCCNVRIWFGHGWPASAAPAATAPNGELPKQRRHHDLQLVLPQQLRQFRDVRGDPPGFVSRRQTRCGPPPGLILEVKLGRLASL